jgi:hypothetical protein
VTAFHDLFVGAVAIVVGCLLILGAAVESPTLMALAKARWLSEALGKAAARWVIAAIGGVSVVIGVLIASGWRIHW